MIVEIEFYQGDTLLYGKSITYTEFLNQIEEIESDYDREPDNFTALLCRRYGWTVTEDKSDPVFVYDRDIQKAYRTRR